MKLLEAKPAPVFRSTFFCLDVFLVGSFFLTAFLEFKNLIFIYLNFVNKIGDLAEEENHHPDITFGWGYCKIKIFTHAIEGLAESDFILAAKIDQI